MRPIVLAAAIALATRAIVPALPAPDKRPIASRLTAAPREITDGDT